MRWDARADANQREIMAALRRAGASVVSLHRVGGGVPDLLVGFRGRNYLLEVKRPKGWRLTPAERTFLAAWGGQVAVVFSAEDALRVIGALHPMQEV